MNLKKQTALALITLFCVGHLGAASKKVKEDQISEMIIQGENRLRVTPKPYDVSWTVNPVSGVQSLMRSPAVVEQLSPPSVENPPLMFPQRLSSGKAARPWLARVYEPPLLTLQFKSAETVGPVTWTFLVKDSRGQVFYEQRKKGALPETLLWDGRGGKGQTLWVGYDYSYSFSAIDEAGHPTRHAGQSSFRIDAFRPRHSGRNSLTQFFPEALFVDPSSLRLSSEGERYLGEIRDFLRNPSGRKVQIIVYDRDAAFALGRARVVRDWLQKVLNIPDRLISAEGLTITQGGGYRHVDIETK